jgi:ABC-2 type transport system permease protein
VFLADLTVWSAVALPGLVVAVVIAWFRFDLDLAFDWPLLATTAVLVTVTAAAVGYMIAVLLPPMITQVVSQALTFFVILFSPISFPASQLPGWFQAVHDVLPVRPAADLVRAGLASTTYEARTQDLVVLVVWCTVGVGVSVSALVRRS